MWFIRWQCKQKVIGLQPLKVTRNAIDQLKRWGKASRNVKYGCLYLTIAIEMGWMCIAIGISDQGRGIA